jgi:hypothetical protein
LLKGLGILGFLPKPQKTVSNKLAKVLGIFGSLANFPLPGVNMRVLASFAIAFSLHTATSPARAKQSRPSFSRAREYSKARYISRGLAAGLPFTSRASSSSSRAGRRTAGVWCRAEEKDRREQIGMFFPRSRFIDQLG